MIVRPYQSSDAADLGDIFHEAVHGLCRLDYSPAQLAVWAPHRPDPSRFDARASQALLTLVATDPGGAAQAYLILEGDGHIDHLYRRPSARGAATELYLTVETFARREGLTRLYTEASEAARRFFARRGFATLHRRDFDLDGVRIHNYAMRKDLPSAPPEEPDVTPGS